MLNQYEKYKVSKNKWFKQIPIDWKEARVSYYFEIGRGRVIAETELIEDGLYPVFSSQTKNNGCLGYINSFDFDGKMLTWTTDGANAGTVFLREGKFNCTNVCGTLSPLKEIDLKFYLYFLQYVTQFYKRPDTNGAKIMNNEMAAIQLLVPSIQEQKQIAKYLDFQTNIIDQLIIKKEKLIGLLKEKRQSIINEAVTKGLDPNAIMKDSGIVWLGEVPEHWKVIKLNYIVYMKSGNFISAEKIEDEGLYPIYGGNGRRGFFSEYTHEGFYPLIGRQGALCGNINYANGKFWATEHAIVVSPKKQIETLWIGELLRLMNLNQYSQASAQPGLSVEKISNLRVPFPDYNEQVLITKHLKLLNHNFDLLNIKLKDNIDKLKEYRQSIISEAVTGKIDVREWNNN